MDYTDAGVFTIAFIDAVTLLCGETVSRADLTDTSATVTPLTDAGVSALSGNYGISDWTVGTARDVLALNEDGTTRTSFTDKDVLYLNDTVSPNTLTLGVTGADGGTVDSSGYPSTLESTSFTKK